MNQMGYPPAPERKNLAKALASAQGKPVAVYKDAMNNLDHNAYASAESLITEGRAALSSSGLSLVPVSSIPDEGEKSLLSTFLLLHESGESLELRYVTPIVIHAKRPRTRRSRRRARTRSATCFTICCCSRASGEMRTSTRATTHRTRPRTPPAPKPKAVPPPPPKPAPVEEPETDANIAAS